MRFSRMLWDCVICGTFSHERVSKAKTFVRTFSVEKGLSKSFIPTLLLLIVFSTVILGCTRNRGNLGSEDNPVKLYFVPSVDAKVIENSSKKIKDYLEKNTPYKYEVSIP